MYILVVQDRNGQVLKQHPVRGEVKIGRGDTNDIVLPSVGVSRHHARIYLKDNKVMVQDLKSANGVMLNNKKVIDQLEANPPAVIVIDEFLLSLQVAVADEPTNQDPLSTQVLNEAKPSGKLCGIFGPFKGEDFSLTERENTIGRTEENFILLPDPSVSRNHARIVRDNSDNYILYDLGSSNGTTLNRRSATKATLKHNDVVCFGDAGFRFHLPGQSTKGAVSSSSSSSSSPNRLLPILLIVGAVLVLGGVTAGIFAKMHYSKVAAEKARLEEEQRQRQESFQGAKAAAEKMRWDDALLLLEPLVEAEFGGDEVPELVKIVKEEIKHRDMMRRADVLFVEDKFDDAREMLQSVPESSRYHQRALARIEAVSKQEASVLLQMGLIACTKNNWKECHEHLVKSLALESDNEEAIKRLRHAENRMRRRRIKYERWEPKPADE